MTIASLVSPGANNDLPVTIDVDGVPVTVWSENGIIYSLTDSAVNSE